MFCSVCFNFLAKFTINEFAYTVQKYHYYEMNSYALVFILFKVSKVLKDWNFMFFEHQNDVSFVLLKADSIDDKNRPSSV